MISYNTVLSTPNPSSSSFLLKCGPIKLCAASWYTQLYRAAFWRTKTVTASVLNCSEFRYLSLRGHRFCRLWLFIVSYTLFLHSSSTSWVSNKKPNIRNQRNKRLKNWTFKINSFWKYKKNHLNYTLFKWVEKCFLKALEILNCIKSYSLSCQTLLKCSL